MMRMYEVHDYLSAATHQQGIIVRPVTEGIAIAPPLTIQEPELDFLVSAIGAALDEVLG